MVERRPSIAIHDVDISLAVEYRLQHLLLLVNRLERQHRLMDWRLILNRSLAVNVLTAVDQVIQVTRVGRLGRVVQILQHTPRKLVLADHQWGLSVVLGFSLCAKIRE